MRMDLDQRTVPAEHGSISRESPQAFLKLLGIKCRIKDSTLTFEQSIPNRPSSSKPSLWGLRDYAEEEVEIWEEPRGRDEIKEIVSSRCNTLGQTPR